MGSTPSVGIDDLNFFRKSENYSYREYESSIKSCKAGGKKMAKGNKKAIAKGMN